jgi:type II secretory pathway pseudopilin PulG
MVVMLILGLLGAIVMLSGRGANEAARRASALAVAQSYSEAVEGFALDHSGRVPVVNPGGTDWKDLEQGPLQPLPKPGTTELPSYLGRGVPEAVQSGTIAVSTTSPTPGGAAPAGGQHGVVVYVPGPAPSTQYRVEVWVVEKGGKVRPRMECYIGSLAPPGGGQQC